jgi:hypothetical protein
MRLNALQAAVSHAAWPAGQALVDGEFLDGWGAGGAYLAPRTQLRGQFPTIPTGKVSLIPRELVAEDREPGTGNHQQPLAQFPAP